MGSDETSARVGGKTGRQWVLLSSTAICYVIANTRTGSVVATVLDDACQQVWVADCYGGQLGHGAVHQMCLAHLLRDATYASEEGDAGFVPGFRIRLLRAPEIGRRREAPKDSTLAQYHADLERQPNRLPAGTMPDQPAARRLFRVMRRDRTDLLRFITRHDVPYINNACERALRPSIIFRKVTGGFRAEWGAEVYAAAPTVIATGRLHGLIALADEAVIPSGRPRTEGGEQLSEKTLRVYLESCREQRQMSVLNGYHLSDTAFGASLHRGSILSCGRYEMIPRHPPQSKKYSRKDSQSKRQVTPNSRAKYIRRAWFITNSSTRGPKLAFIFSTVAGGMPALLRTPTQSIFAQVFDSVQSINSCRTDKTTAIICTILSSNCLNSNISLTKSVIPFSEASGRQSRRSHCSIQLSPIASQISLYSG